MEQKTFIDLISRSMQKTCPPDVLHGAGVAYERRTPSIQEAFGR